MKTFLTEPDGSPSSMRLAFLGWAFGALLVWAGVSVYHGALQDVPVSVVTVLLGLGVGKVVQRPMEAKAEG